MAKQDERSMSVDVYEQPTGVQDSVYPDEPSDADLEADELRYQAARRAAKLMPGFTPGPEGADDAE